MMMLIVAGLLAGAPPSAEAEALGLRLAQRGMLASMLPMMTAKDTDELVASHPALSPDDQVRLREDAKVLAKAGGERLFAAIGHSYAATLSVEDMTAVIAFQESPTAARYKAAEPKAIMAAMQALGGLDYRKDVWTRFCAHAAAPKPKGCE